MLQPFRASVLSEKGKRINEWRTVIENSITRFLRIIGILSASDNAVAFVSDRTILHEILNLPAKRIACMLAFN